MDFMLQVHDATALTSVGSKGVWTLAFLDPFTPP